MYLSARKTTRELKELLVCPICKGALIFSPHLILCHSCEMKYPQLVTGVFDLIPEKLLAQEVHGWKNRQMEMHAWYKDLLSSPSEAIMCFKNDYAPYKSLLSDLSGSILDIGGGNAIVRCFLPKATEYIALDPSLEWLQSDWQKITSNFSYLKEKLKFVRGVGEYLPFPAQSFDHVLSFWSLNHTIYPDRVFREVHHVLRQGGRFLIVLEDMEPRWRDIHNLLSQIYEMKRKRALILSKIQSSLRMHKWPLQKDHIYIHESDIVAWSSDYFDISFRKWIGECLTYELHRQ